MTNKKFVVLGVAFGWGFRKGLDVFVLLSKRLDEKYQIVMVGVDDKTKSELPKNIITIKRTNNQSELASIYSAADVFVNPTREDNYPTVNMEAIACGTPVITFNTGGSPEIIKNNITGIVIPNENIDLLIESIEKICDEKDKYRSACLENANLFDESKTYKKYLSLYEDCLL